jgi:hypothetical protein
MTPARSALSKWHVALLCSLNGHRRVEDRGEMGEVVIQDAHLSHVLMYRDLLGFLDRLCLVVTLLLSCVDKEDGQLVKLDAVQEGRLVS